MSSGEFAEFPRALLCQPAAGEKLSCFWNNVAFLQVFTIARAGVRL
jgi:hypothetical protein